MDWVIPKGPETCAGDGNRGSHSGQWKVREECKKDNSETKYWKAHLKLLNPRVGTHSYASKFHHEYKSQTLEAEISQKKVGIVWE